jgi:hypothetical protein
MYTLSILSTEPNQVSVSPIRAVIVARKRRVAVPAQAAARQKHRPPAKTQVIGKRPNAHEPKIYTAASTAAKNAVHRFKTKRGVVFIAQLLMPIARGAHSPRSQANAAILVVASGRLFYSKRVSIFVASAGLIVIRVVDDDCP